MILMLGCSWVGSVKDDVILMLGCSVVGSVKDDVVILMLGCVVLLEV